MTFRRRGYDNIQKKWAPIAKEDPIEALLAVEEDLGLLSVVRNYKWDDYLYSKLPTSNLPKNVKNAEMINAILVKSWETQGSDCPSNPRSEPLASNDCIGVNGLLMYYFKSLNIADNMSRIVGSLSRTHTFVHSFLKFGDHVIDNTFVLGHMKNWINKKESLMVFDHMKKTSKYNIGDPADPKYGVIPQSSEIGKLFIIFRAKTHCSKPSFLSKNSTSIS